VIVDEKKQFLQEALPFSFLSSDELDQCLKHLKISYSKVGDLLEGGKEKIIYLVRTGSIELRDKDGKFRNRMGEGDSLIMPLHEKEGQAKCIEDCLIYQFPLSVSELLGEHQEPFEHFFNGAISTQSPLELSGTEHNFCLTQSVEELMACPPICCGIEDSILQVAQQMSDKKISSILVTDGGLLKGILTDRDLRSRVLANQVDPASPVSAVMTSQLTTVNPDQSFYDAKILMMTENIHHLPVEENGKALGIITLNDVVRANNSEPLFLIQAISRARDLPALKEVSALLPELTDKMIRASVRAEEIGRILTSITDAITKQLIHFISQEIGSAPCAYAWVAFGSQARQDQMLGSDQDNGLILERELDADEAEYFETFARFVNTGLDQCGLKFCPGEIMAMNIKWRKPLDVWIEYFSDWIRKPEPKALMHASIFYDIRCIAGDQSLTEKLLSFVLAEARKNTIFQACMAENVLQATPPLGFFKTFVLEKDGNHNSVLDLKHRGTVPIVAMARLYALSEGLVQVNTKERLLALSEASILSKSEATNLLDAHEFVAGLRLANQSKQIHAHMDVSNNLDPKTLSPLVRHQLKDAFSVVAESQRLLKMRFRHGAI
jgi:CBS domain-containing protein